MSTSKHQSTNSASNGRGPVVSRPGVLAPASAMKRAAAIAALRPAALLTRRYQAVRDGLAEVHADLRSPALLALKLSITARSLWLIRLGSRVRTSPGLGVTVTKRTVPTTPPVQVQVTTPDAAPDRASAVLYIHGGGMIIGSPQAESMISGPLARELGAVVVAPKYRLAPKHPFPAALDDCMGTLKWMRDNADDLGIDPDRLAVTGSSAGGGLAAAVAQRAHDEGIQLRAQALIYPMIDDRAVLRDDHAGRGRFGWSPASNRFAWTAYLGREPRMSDAPEYAAPARRLDLTGIAPAWIGVGSLDLFHDEAINYADALQHCGVACELVVVPGMYHAADLIVAKSPAMKAFRQNSIDHLRTHLRPSPSIGVVNIVRTSPETPD